MGSRNIINLDKELGINYFIYMKLSIGRIPAPFRNRTIENLPTPENKI
jgi:hypothetical protein